MNGAVPYQLELHEKHKARQARFLAAALQLEIETPRLGESRKPDIEKRKQIERAIRESKRRAEKAKAEAEAEAAALREITENPHLANFDLVADVVRNQIKVIDAVAVATRYYGVTIDDIYSHRCDRKVVPPRHLAMFLARMTTQLSLPKIARKLRKKDHSTIIHGLRKINARIAADVQFKVEVDSLIAELKALAWKRAAEIQGLVGAHVRAADAIGWRPE